LKASRVSVDWQMEKSLDAGASVGKPESGVKEKGVFMGSAGSRLSRAVDVWDQTRYD